MKGPWPRPTREATKERAVTHALAHPAWGHRKVWAMVRHDGHVVSEATVLRLLRDEQLILPAKYQRERKRLAEARKAAFTPPVTGPNEVWQLDFREFETTTGGTWRLAGCRDYYSKYEHPFHTSPTGNQHDAIEAIELALAEYERLFGYPLIDACHVHPLTGDLISAVTVVTDNGGPFKSFNFERFILSHPELRHVRTRARSPGQNGSRERGFGSLKYERLFLDGIPDALTLVERAEDYRIEYHAVRPTRPSPGTGRSISTSDTPTPTPPPSKPKKSCQLLGAGQGAYPSLLLLERCLHGTRGSPHRDTACLPACLPAASSTQPWRLENRVRPRGLIRRASNTKRMKSLL